MTLSCNDKKGKKHSQSLTDSEKNKINLFIDSLLVSVNNHEYDLIEKSWIIKKLDLLNTELN